MLFLASSSSSLLLLFYGSPRGRHPKLGGFIHAFPFCPPAAFPCGCFAAFTSGDFGTRPPNADTAETAGGRPGDCFDFGDAPLDATWPFILILPLLPLLLAAGDAANVVNVDDDDADDDVDKEDDDVGGLAGLLCDTGCAAAAGDEKNEKEDERPTASRIAGFHTACWAASWAASSWPKLVSAAWSRRWIMSLKEGRSLGAQLKHASRRSLRDGGRFSRLEGN